MTSLPPAVTEETLNHLLQGASIMSINLYQGESIHVLLDNLAILAVSVRDGELDVDVMGPSEKEARLFAWTERERLEEAGS